MGGRRGLSVFKKTKPRKGGVSHISLKRLRSNCLEDGIQHKRGVGDLVIQGSKPPHVQSTPTSFLGACWGVHPPPPDLMHSSASSASSRKQRRLLALRPAIMDEVAVAHAGLFAPLCAALLNCAGGLAGRASWVLPSLTPRGWVPEHCCWRVVVGCSFFFGIPRSVGVELAFCANLTTFSKTF